MSEYSFISDPSESLGQGINVSQLGQTFTPRNAIRNHLPTDMMNEPPRRQQQLEPMIMMPPPQPNCMDFFNHLENCPLCTGHYKKDKFYMIIIAILVFIIFYLLHKK